MPEGVDVDYPLRRVEQLARHPYRMGRMGWWDVTWSAKDEFKLTASKELLQKVIDGIMYPVMIIDRDYKITFTNQAAKETAGADVHALACYQVSHHRDRPCEESGEACPLKQVFETRKPVTVIHEHFDAKGRAAYVEVNATPIIDENGEVIQIVETCYDISKRRQVEQLFHEEENRYRTLFDRATDGIFVIDLDLKIIDVNESFARMHGYTVDELHRMSLGDLDTEETKKHIPERMNDILELGALNFDVEHYHKDGHVIALSVAANRIELGGKPCILCFHRDITERKQAEEEARELRQELAHVARVTMLGELFTAMAHELNQPLSAILNNAEAAKIFLSRPELDVEEINEIISDIISDNKRATDVIRKIRGLAKKSEQTFEPLELGSVIQETVRFIKHGTTFGDTNLVMMLEAEPVKVRGDRVHLQQVLINLILNALDAMKECPEKTLTIRSVISQPEAVTISVKDTGAGVAKKERGNLFRPFFTTKHDGLGIGLSICRSIIEGHGGRLWFENNPDRGATFCFSLNLLKGEGQ